MPERFAAIIPAAGRSSRMGACKALLPLAGVPMLDRCVCLFRECGLRTIIVVVNEEHEETLQRVRRLDALPVVNPVASKRDMYSSILAGAAILPAAVTAFFVLPCDMPLVRPDTLNMLMDRWSQAGTDFRGVLRPKHEGRGGHPPLIHADHAAGMRAWRCCGGLGGYLGNLPSAGPGGVLDVRVDDPGVILDVDTPADYRRAQAMIRM
jgi:molybdenum cofactor cytidylyltransferase